jgi:4-hydroxy-3-methylbut-2-enyl diphosphate reductase
LEIIRAKKMGFCSGVDEAVNLAHKLCSEFEDRNIYMVGMLVHNKEVIAHLNSIGIEIVEEKDILEGKINFKKEDVVIVRAHGTIKEIYRILEESEAKIYDAACIFVKRIRNLMKKEIEEGYEIIFLGDKNHPEVKGIISHGKNIKVFADLDELKKSELDKEGKYFFMAQTTLSKIVYNEIKSYIDKEFLNSKIGNTICGATYVRQEAVEELAKKTDIVLIVGGKNSSNTKKLYEISKKINERSYLLENYKDFDKNWLKDAERVGITAGASTPEKSIREIERIIKGEIL